MSCSGTWNPLCEGMQLNIPRPWKMLRAKQRSAAVESRSTTEHTGDAANPMRGRPGKRHIGQPRPPRKRMACNADALQLEKPDAREQNTPGRLVVPYELR